MNRWIFGLLLFLTGIGIGGALTLRGQTRPAVNAERGLALHGYDVVAYFEEGRAVKGSIQFTATHDGVTWRFSTAARRDAFLREPQRFAPQFGGFCAYGVSRGYAVDVDPEAFAVVDGRLYLNYSKRVQRLWDQDRPGHIETARANWSKVAAEVAAGKR